MNRIALIALGILTLARFVLLPSTELDPDEAYVALCAGRPDWHYAQGGPLPPLLSRLGMWVFGENEFGHRFFAPLLALAMTLAAANLAAGIANGRAALWAAAGLSLLPAMAVASTRVTVASCSAAFMTLLFWCWWRALHGHRRKTYWWAASGVAGACCLLCHAGNVLLVLGVMVALLLVPRWRRNLLGRGFLLGVSVMALGLVPFLLWEAEVRSLALMALGKRFGLGYGAEGFSLAGVIRFFSGYGLAYSPLVGLGMLWVMWRGLWSPSASHGGGYLVAFSAPLVLGAFLLAAFTGVDPLILLPASVPLLARLAEHWVRVSSLGSFKTGLRTVALAVSAVMAATVSQTDLPRRAGLSWAYSREDPAMLGAAYWWPFDGDPTAMHRGWRELAAILGEVKDEAAGEAGEAFLIAPSAEVAALLDFYLPKDGGGLAIFPVATLNPTEGLIGWGGYDGRLPVSGGGGLPPLMLAGRDALFLSLDDGRGLPRPVSRAFGQSEEVFRADLVRGGELLRKVRIVACYDYRGLPL